jgi:type IV pilus assembly protein PilB
MEDMTSKSSMSGFVAYISEIKILDKQIGLEALKQSALNNVSFIDYLVKNRLIDSTSIAKATSEYFGLPLCDITAFNFELIPTEFLNIQFVRKRLALPLFIKNGFLYLALTDPTLESLSDVVFLTGHDIRLLVTDGAQLTQAIDILLNTLIISEIKGTQTQINEKVTSQLNNAENSDLATYDAESAPVVNYVNKIIIDAIEKNASDIHFEHYDKEYRIRYRMHGVLYPIATPPLKLANYLLARIKIMSSLDITEHRIPQDGRFKLNLSQYKSIDFRVSVCPSLYGEKIVLRLLDPAQIFHNLDELGMDENQKNHLQNALTHTQGIILVTGPTGSGKTVTLYSALNHLNSTDDNIMTVEDPVEIPMRGVNQVHINPKVGLTFAAALRAFLRQDPDIIMVGEIRDLETAQISVQAAQTGHLVLSTLHTNSGPETIARLMYMGVESYNLASSLILVIAQRLLRVLCGHCKQKEDLPHDIMIKEGFKKEEIGTFQLYKAGSCQRCTHGYKGRTGIFEVMPITEEMRFLMIRGANTMELTEQSKKEGVYNLREAGLAKIKMGITSLAELNRTFK